MINKFNNESEPPKDTFEHLYYLPNVLRMFVETYLSFKYLSRKNIDENIHDLISNQVECERARKLMNYHSHSLTINNLIGFPDLAESTDVVNIIIKAVKKDDSTHYNSLVEAVK